LETSVASEYAFPPLEGEQFQAKEISMSQYPPPQYPPPNPPPPPGGYPGGGGMPPGAQASNGLAITSLIMGILSCIPGVGLLAILFGALGIGKAKDPRYGGKGLAIVGIVLGLISIVVWGGIGYGVYWGVGKIKEMASGFQFVEALSRGSVAEAKTFSTGKMSDAELSKLAVEMKTLGKLKQMQNPTNSFQNNVLDIQGTGIFENGTRKVHFVMINTPTGWKVDKLTLE
jgi:hypothetical protein